MNNMLNIRAKDFQILNYLSVKKTQLISFVLFSLWLSYTDVSFGQTMGMVIKPALTPNNAVQDPDGDGYISQKTNGVQLGFTTLPSKCIFKNEIHCIDIQDDESVCGLFWGPSGSISKLIGSDTAGHDTILRYSNGIGLLYQFRVGNLAPSSKSDSIMIDTDGKFGFARTKANPKEITGIHGFQAANITQINLNVSAYNVKGIVFLFAQLCAQNAQFTPLFIHSNKIG